MLTGRAADTVKVEAGIGVTHLQQSKHGKRGESSKEQVIAINFGCLVTWI